jgi:hypothetical protein
MLLDCDHDRIVADPIVPGLQIIAAIRRALGTKFDRAALLESSSGFSTLTAEPALRECGSTNRQSDVDLGDRGVDVGGCLGVAGAESLKGRFEHLLRLLQLAV